MPDDPNIPGSAQRASEREIVVTRTFDARPHAVFDAWAEAARFRRWWVPASFGLTLEACELDVRVGGGYRLVFRHPAAAEPMTFHGRYLDVTRPERLVWTNDEAGGGGQITTVTFEDSDGKTLLVLRECYPTKAALDEAIESGSACAMDETFDQLAAELAASSRP